MPSTHYTTTEADARIADIEQRLEALEAGTPEPPDPIDPPDPPDPPEDEPLIYGYAHTNRAKLEADTGVYVAADRIFDTTTPSNWSQTKMASLPTRYQPFYSFKPGSGASWGSPNTNNFRKFVESIPRPTVVIPSHEPENDGNNPSTFKSMITTLAEIVGEVANPNVHLAVCLMTSWADKSTAQGGSAAYIPDPASLAVPLGLTWDGYRHEGSGSKTPEQIYAAPKDLTEDSGHAWWGIMETAAETDAAAWVGDVTDWVVAEGGRACLYWPSQTSDSGSVNWYPPSSAFDEFAEVALRYGGQHITTRYAP